jgi:hypothetical protein
MTTTKYLSQDSRRSPGRNLNPGPPECEVGMQTTRPRRQVMSLSWMESTARQLRQWNDWILTLDLCFPRALRPDRSTAVYVRVCNDPWSTKRGALPPCLHAPSWCGALAARPICLHVHKYVVSPSPLRRSHCRWRTIEPRGYAQGQAVCAVWACLSLVARR